MLSSLNLTRRTKIAIGFFVVSFAVFAAFTGSRIKQQTIANHFIWLADAYLHGQLELRVTPQSAGDWAGYEVITLESDRELEGIWLDKGQQVFRTLDHEVVDLTWDEFPHSNRGIAPQCPNELPPPSEREGFSEHRCARHFVSFPPGPAVLMLPGVAIWGLSFNDMLFTLFFSALAIPILFLFLERLRDEEKIFTSEAENILLTAAFAFATNFLWCSAFGRVWFTAQITAIVFTLLYMHAALDARRPFWAGLWLACAFACRTPTLFSVVFFAAFFFFPGGRFRKDFGKSFWVDGIKFAIVPLIVGLTLMWMNEARFHSFTTFGHTYIDFGQNYRIREYGLFNYRFLSFNLTAMFTLLPRILDHYPYIEISKHGMALWLSSPVLLWAVWPSVSRMTSFTGAERLKDAPVSQSYYRWIFWLTVLAIALPHMFYQSSGWGQTGYRYALDYHPYLFALIALSNHRFLKPGFIAAVIFGFVVNGFGAITFERHHEFHTNFYLDGTDTAQGL